MAIWSNLTKGLLVALLVGVLIDGCTARCMRHAKGVARNSRKSGDGGYRIYIDGEPERYQPGKIYNGRRPSFNLAFIRAAMMVAIQRPRLTHAHLRIACSVSDQRSRQQRVHQPLHPVQPVCKGCVERRTQQGSIRPHEPQPNRTLPVVRRRADRVQCRLR